MINIIINLNIFDSQSSDEHMQQNKKISTKVYFMALTICLISFVFYTSLEKQASTVFVYNPTQSQFDQLNNESMNDLQCSCSEISVKYTNFIRFDPEYHEICSSIFISDLWYNAYMIWNDRCWYLNFPNYAGLYFRLLSTYCQLAQETVANTLLQFYEMEYITSQVVIKNRFDSDTISFIELFKTRTQHSLKQQLNIIQSVIFNNKFISLWAPNTYFVPVVENEMVEILSYFKIFNDCSCRTDRICLEQIGFCEADSAWRYLPGLYISCYVHDALLMSTTQCFYDQTCVDIIKEYIIQTSELYGLIHILNGSETSRYRENETIETLLNNLFIENWNDIYSYEKYYNQCRPSVCSYTLEQKPSVLYILTKLISVYGGLAILLRFLVPNIINIIRQKKIQQQGICLHKIVSIF